MILLRVVAFAMRYLVNNRFYIDNNLEGVDGSFYVLYEQLIALPAWVKDNNLKLLYKLSSVPCKSLYIL